MFDILRDCRGCTALDSPTVNSIFSLGIVEELEADQLTDTKANEAENINKSSRRSGWLGMSYWQLQPPKRNDLIDKTSHVFKGNYRRPPTPLYILNCENIKQNSTIFVVVARLVLLSGTN